MEATMWKRLIAWLDRNVAVQHLASLDDRMLADIGVERDGLRARVMGRGMDPVLPEHSEVEPRLSLQTACRC
jgi:uncharacterized protein YjiS (DUF1127 family)